MTSFGYRLNPRYTIKERLSCTALYTGDFCCSKGNVKDKILVPKLLKNYARCARCGHPVDGPYCQGCTLLRKKLEEDLVTYFQDFQNTSESSDDSTNVVNAPREPFVVKQDQDVNPSHIDECCCECGDALDGIFCQQCTCKSYGKGAMLNMVTIVHLKFRLSIRNRVTVKTLISCKIFMIFNNSISVVISMGDRTRLFNIPACCDDDDDYNSAITPVLSTEEPDNSLSMGDEHLDTIPATESEKVVKSSVEDLVPIPSEFEGIPDTMCDEHLVNNPTPLEAKDHFEIVVSLEVAEIVIPKEEEIEDDNLHEKLLNVHLLITNIEALKDNPTPSSEFLTKSSSTSSKSFLEETNTFDNYLPEFKNFCFDLEEISSGSTTAHSDISLSDYEAFYFDDDHIEEISSGSTTTHSDISLSEYDSFIFDISNDQFPHTNRSEFTHKEFTNELAYIISRPKYDCFYFRNLPDLGELISILNFGIHENLSSTTRVNLPDEDDHSPLLAYVVWIFLAYLMYLVISPYLYSFGNEDTIFDPGIAINHFYSFKPGLSDQCGTFKKFNTHRSHLNKSTMEMFFSTCFLMDQ
nr:hypothetical protein [Tanacetum cinerariifolium]